MTDLRQDILIVDVHGSPIAAVEVKIVTGNGAS
jgi:hypothetical protein